MAEFKTVSGKSSQIDLLLALSSSAFAFLIYALTLSPGAYPGQSALLMATCAGIEPAVAPNHPLWMLITSALSGMHVLTLPLRLNLFSAVCGALGVGLMYRLLSFLVRQIVHDESVSDRQLNTAATLAGLAGAAAMAFSIPYWSAATRLQYQSFDILFLLATFYLIVIYAKTGRMIMLMLLALCYGVGIVESTTFIACAPVAGAFTIFTLWKRDRLSQQSLALLCVLALLGVSTYVLFAWRFFKLEDIGLRGYRSILDVVVYMWRDQYHEFQGAIPRVGWVWILFQSILPALAAAVASRRALNNERSWSFYLLHLILSVLAVCVLTNVPFSPWRMLQTGGVLPVATYSLMAMVTGYLAAYWYLLMVVKGSRHDQQISNLTKRTGNWMGLVLTWPLIALVVVAAGVNAFEANGRRGTGADAYALEILKRLGARTWIVTDGTLDYHIEILARQRGQTVHLLCLQKDMNKVYQRQLVRTIEQEDLFRADRQRMLNTLDLGVLPFIQDWFAGDGKIASKVLVLGVPDLWYGAGLLPQPDQIGFTGVRSYDGLDGLAMAADHLAFWNRMEKVLPRNVHTAEPTALFCNTLRRHMGFVGNNLGVMLEDMGHTNEAAQIYARVRQIDPDNISALFNQFEMARHGTDAKLKEAIDKEMREFIGRQHQQYPLWSLSRYYGYVRSPELFVRLGWSWALSGQKEAALAGIRRAQDLVPKSSNQEGLQQAIAAIYLLRDERSKSEEVYRQILEKDPENRGAILSMARLAVADGALDKARGWLEKVQGTGMARNQLGVEWAAIHMAAGELPQARLQLQATLDLQPNNLQAWGMLAVVMLQQADRERVEGKDYAATMKEVEQSILPKMETVAGSPDQYFIQIVRAQVAMTKGSKFYRVAREAYIRASMLRPDVPKLNDVILQLDIALADQSRGEQHAREVLRVNRKHALANYVMGSLRLQSGQYGEAVDYLTRSVETEPLPAALNDLAEALRRIRKLSEAEARAREATVKSPDLYVAWETLASILMDQNRLKEAETALDKALSFKQDDIRMQISMARLQFLNGDMDRARSALKLVRNRQGELSPYDLAQYERLANDVAHRR